MVIMNRKLSDTVVKPQDSILAKFDPSTINSGDDSINGNDGHDNNNNNHNSSDNSTASGSRIVSSSGDNDEEDNSDIDALPQPAHAQIFERSVQDCIKPLSRKLTICKEDFIPSTLDAATSILSNNTNLDDVEMIYSRRNSSVVGLQSALGRSRKNSCLSVDTNHHLPQNSSCKRSPQLKSSKSQLNFFSYVDLINNDEFAKKSRPNFNSSYSSGVIPTKKSPLASQSTRKFMISPETSSDEYDDDNRSLISSSMGECLRETRVEINH